MIKENMKKVLAGTLTAAMLLGTPGASLLAATDTGLDLTAVPVTEVQKMAYYASVSGTIVGIDEFESNGETYRLIAIEGEDGSPSVLTVSKDTILTEGLTLALGVKVTGFYQTGMPMLMIYPPQYRAAAIAAQQEDTVYADIFDENLVSEDGQLKLNIGENTKIVDQQGKPYGGSLVNRHLLVYHTVTTRSIPAQTTPSKIVVLDVAADETIPDENIDEDFLREIPFVDGKLDLLVEGRPVKSPGAYVNEEGVVMVPLREVLRALGHRYKWVGSQRRGLINGGALVVIPGRDIYGGRGQVGQAISLGAAPQMKGIRLYVPLSFFRDVLGVNNAYVLEGQVVIDNGELMF